MKSQAHWKRHLEGWELGVALIASAVLATLLSVPRPVEPSVLPLPRVDRRLQMKEADNEAQRRAEAYNSSLPLAVRAVGEALRAYGLASVKASPAELAAVQQDLRSSVAIALDRHLEAQLLQLRAVQTELFTTAVTYSVARGSADAEALELGGTFWQHARQNGWFRRGQALLSQRDIELLFRMRWVRLTGLTTHDAFAPSLNEWRQYYRFRLRQPEINPKDTSPRAQAARSLGYVEALAKLDTRYPAFLARGILYHQMQEEARARTALSDFLSQEQSGRWQLRARNYLAKLSRTEPRDP